MSPKTVRIAIVIAAAVVASSLSLGASSALAASPLVVIDPGHGGPFSNANANGLHERTVTLQIGKALRAELQGRGYRVVMTRTTNRALQTADAETWNMNLNQSWAYARDGQLYYSQSIPKDDLDARTRLANNLAADLFISIHCNGAASASAHGTETWASPHDAAGQALARLVQPALVKRSKLTDRGWHKADFYVLRWTNMPAILVESAFVTNRSDASRLKKSASRAAIAKGIADGVDRWFSAKPAAKTMPRASASSQALASAMVSRTDFPSGATRVVITRSDRATDTPGAPALAARLGAPLLQTPTDTPTAALVDEIGRLGAHEVVLAGLAGSLDASATRVALGAAHVSATVTSIEASDRAGLSLKLATKMGAPGSSGSVMLANAADDRAIMALVPVSARTQSPILLTGTNDLGACTTYLQANACKIRRVVRAGCAKSPAAYTTAATVLKVQYKDPTRVALALNTATFVSTKAGSMTPVVVNTTKPGDLLTAATRAARLGQPVVPLVGYAMSPYTRLFITNHRAQIKGFSLIESGSSLPATIETLLKKADAL